MVFFEYQIVRKDTFQPLKKQEKFCDFFFVDSGFEKTCYLSWLKLPKSDKDDLKLDSYVVSFCFPRNVRVKYSSTHSAVEAQTTTIRP